MKTCLNSGAEGHALTKLVLFGYPLVRFVDVLDAILKRFAFWWQ
jgi:hypothetical protein